MFVAEPSITDLPTYVTMVSRGNEILAFGHMEDFASALVWCGRAMQQYPDAVQVAIGRPTLVNYPRIGKVSAVLPFEGWLRSLDGWRYAPQHELQRFFDRVGSGPRTLTTVIPPAMPASTSGFEEDSTEKQTRERPVVPRNQRRESAPPRRASAS